MVGVNSRCDQCDSIHFPQHPPLLRRYSNRNSVRNVRKCDANARRACHTEKSVHNHQKKDPKKMNDGTPNDATPPAWKLALLRSTDPDVQETMARVADLREELDEKWNVLMEMIRVMDRAKEVYDRAAEEAGEAANILTEDVSWYGEKMVEAVFEEKEVNDEMEFPPGVSKSGELLTYAAFAMAHCNGTTVDSFTEENEPDHDSDTWRAWKMVKITEWHYHRMHERLMYEMKNPDETEFEHVDNDDIPINN